MTRTYDVGLDVSSAGGFLASKYLDATGTGVLTVDSTSEDAFLNPENKVFKISGKVLDIMMRDGEHVEADLVSKIVLPPTQYVYHTGKPLDISGSGWRGTVKVTLNGNRILVDVTGTGTGLKSLAVNSVRVILTGTLRQ
jgi:hypothetical protein